MDILHPQDDYTFVEFSQINWKYGGKKYRSVIFKNVFFKFEVFFISKNLGMAMQRRMNSN